MNQILDRHMTADSAPERDRRPGRGKLAVFLLAAFLLIAILSACGGDDASESAMAGDQAPAFTLSDQFGETYNFTPGDGRDHVLVFYMGYFCGGCRTQLGELAKQIDELSSQAEVVAISVDSPDESAKMNRLIDGRVRLLEDSDLNVIRRYDMEMEGNMANAGYVIVNGDGQIVERKTDPLFGNHVSDMLAALNRS